MNEMHTDKYASCDGGVNVLVLAASRSGAADSVARLQNKSNKCLVEIAGRPMIEIVVGAILATGLSRKIYISIEPGVLPGGLPQMAKWLAQDVVRLVPSRDNLAASVLAVAQGEGMLPLVVTTGDNALHGPEIVADFISQFLAGSGDVAVGLTEEMDVVGEFPESGLFWHRMKDGNYSACNLYGLRNPRALKAVGVFVGGGQFGKRHWRILKAFGVMPFVYYKLRLMAAAQLMRRIGKNLGVTIDTVMLPYAGGPIDVDNPASFAMTEKALRARAAMGS